MEGAEVCIAEIWKAWRLAAVAVGKVSAEAAEKELLEAERKQARQQRSLVLSLANEVAGTRQQVPAPRCSPSLPMRCLFTWKRCGLSGAGGEGQAKALEVMEELNLTGWPGREAEVKVHLAKCGTALQHLTAARKMLEEAANEESKHKILVRPPSSRRPLCEVLGR